MLHILQRYNLEILEGIEDAVIVLSLTKGHILKNISSTGALENIILDLLNLSYVYLRILI